MTGEIVGAEDHRKRGLIRGYFSPPSFLFPASALVLGALLLSNGSRGPGIAALLTGALLFLIFFGSAKASDQQIDSWFQEDLARLEARALQRIGLDRDDLENHPVVIVGPILWHRPGISKSDLLWRRGADNNARFAISSVTIIFLGEHFLNSYGCDFNFLNNLALNEHDSQYQYKNVVGVSIGEEEEQDASDAGEKTTRKQTFSLSFTSGGRISVVVSTDELKDLTRAHLPTTGVEKAVSTIRAMLKSKA